MKQIIQDLKKGKTILEDVPAPQIKQGNVHIKTRTSLVSLGTEKMLVEFGKSSLISKAKQQPDKVKMVLDKIKADGLLPTMEAVFKKLGEPLPLGYCNAGEVVAVGENVLEFKVGDRVVSNGPHAEMVLVPKNLVAKIPDNVSYDEASFTVVGSIGLQGIRLVNPSFGDNVVVVGLGLIGLITGEILVANGCNVIGFDLDENKIKRAQEKGIQAYNSSKVDVVKMANSLSGNKGVDSVIITASTSSNELISQAAQMCRVRGKVVLVGVIGLDISRADFYKKEIEFQVSCSYGPGRYDVNYEDSGIDYPIGFVRWTENRNFKAILSAISKKQLDVKSLITEKVELKDYLKVYNDLSNKNSIASLLQYDPEQIDLTSNVEVTKENYDSANNTVAIVGAGNFTKMTMLPILANINANIKYIVSQKGLSGTSLAKKYGIGNSSSDFESVLKDSEVNAVIITTRHNLHSEMVLKGLEAQKHVFVEKPLALTYKELDDVEAVISKANKSIYVGFNRRFAPFVELAKKEMDSSQPISVNINVNAGFIPEDVWVHNMKEGGGRIIGEGCHFIDLISFFADSKIEKVCALSKGNSPTLNSDNVSILIKCQNGSQGVVNYWANGNKAYSKERIELFWQGKNIIIDNYKKITGYGTSFSSKKSMKLDKGHGKQFKKYNDFLLNGGEPLIPLDQLINSSRAAIAVVESLNSGTWVTL